MRTSLNQSNYFEIAIQMYIYEVTSGKIYRFQFSSERHYLERDYDYMYVLPYTFKSVHYFSLI